MKRVLLTAFGPYGPWQANASWLALVELTRDLPAVPEVTTRLYPVDFNVVRGKLEADLQEGYDYVIHLGQAPGAASLHLEAIALNVGALSTEHPDAFHVLVEKHPVAYQSSLPLADWASQLRAAGIPARVSFHAGTYLCNALYYLTHDYCAQHALDTKALFVHVPLAPEQTYTSHDDTPSMASPTVAKALRLILELLQ